MRAVQCSADQRSEEKRREEKRREEKRREEHELLGHKVEGTTIPIRPTSMRTSMNLPSIPQRTCTLPPTGRTSHCRNSRRHCCPWDRARRPRCSEFLSIPYCTSTRPIPHRTCRFGPRKTCTCTSSAAASAAAVTAVTAVKAVQGAEAEAGGSTRGRGCGRCSQPG